MLFVLRKKVGAEHRPDIMILQKRRQKRGTEGMVNRMSDDLISRKALLEVIDISFIIPILKMNLRPEHEAVLKIREIIMNMPTAFDKEKVIEQLDGCRVYQFQGMLPDGRVCHFSDVIEIVERGGAE